MKTESTAIPAPHADRIARARAAMAKQRLDGYLVEDRRDQYWLTGFTGEDGLVLVTPRVVVLLTDGRFDEAADSEAPYARKVLRKKRGPEATARALKRSKVRRLGFNPDHMNVRNYAALKKLARPTNLVSASGLIGDMRCTKEPGEIAVIRQAIEIAERAFQFIETWVKPGMTEREVAARLVYEMQRLGAQGPSFPPIVAVGPNASLPHYEPGDRQVSEREPILFDWGCTVDWYVSDLTRMFYPGSIPPQIARIHEIVREAHDRAIAAVRPGLKAAALDKVARDVIRQAGFGERFNHSLGHGIGIEVHESPGLRKISKEVLKPGMVITIEPGIYLPGVGGVRIEDDVLVTETGYEVLSSLPTELPRR